jgi:hypothetical protein
LLDGQDITRDSIVKRDPRSVTVDEHARSIVA